MKIIIKALFLFVTTFYATMYGMEENSKALLDINNNNNYHPQNELMRQVHAHFSPKKTKREKEFKPFEQDIKKGYKNVINILNDPEKKLIFFEQIAPEEPDSLYKVGCYWLYEDIYGSKSADYPILHQLFNAAAIKNHPKASLLGYFVLKHNENKIDWRIRDEYNKYNKYNEYYKHQIAILAFKGIPQAQFLQATLIEQDLKQKIIWLRKAADNGHYYAAKEIFQNHFNDDPQQLFNYLVMAAQQSKNAQYQLAQCYEEGKGTEKNPAKAVEYYKKAADNNHIEALAHLARAYQNGELGLETNHNKVFSFYKKQEELLQSNADNQLSYKIGIMYKKGLGTEKNTQRAIQYFERAAIKQHHKACYWLARHYLEGKHLEKNIPLGLYYLDQASRRWPASDEKNLAEIDLIHLYKHGFEDTPKNLEELIAYYESFNIQNRYDRNKKNEKALLALAKLYECDDVIQQDLQKSFDYYEQLTNYYENPIACYKAARLLEQGNLKTSSYFASNHYYYKEAIKHSKQPEYQNNPDVLFYLGIMHELGKGTRKDKAKALHYYTKAAELGHQEAQEKILQQEAEKKAAMTSSNDNNNNNIKPVEMVEKDSSEHQQCSSESKSSAQKPLLKKSSSNQGHSFFVNLLWGGKEKKQ